MAGRLGNVALQFDPLLLLTESATVGRRKMDIESNHGSYIATLHIQTTHSESVLVKERRDIR